ncbi:MAG: hypothetical protein CM15mP128_4240 [Methanobacteriota archaeon]|nr:MAG: hypothetical protein CM15mP128_4240 [Euryarchaeota archaeon]
MAQQSSTPAPPGRVFDLRAFGTLTLIDDIDGARTSRGPRERGTPNRSGIDGPVSERSPSNGSWASTPSCRRRRASHERNRCSGCGTGGCVGVVSRIEAPADSAPEGRGPDRNSIPAVWEAAPVANPTHRVRGPFFVGRRKRNGALKGPDQVGRWGRAHPSRRCFYPGPGGVRVASRLDPFWGHHNHIRKTIHRAPSLLWNQKALVTKPGKLAMTGGHWARNRTPRFGSWSTSKGLNLRLSKFPGPRSGPWKGRNGGGS